MKTLLLIAFALVSFNVYSAELGEDQKSPCPYADQTMKREAKPVIAEISTEAPADKDVKTISK